MPNVAPIASTASTGLGVALPLLTSLSNPVSAAIAGGVGLIALVDKIGQGRKAADKFTQNGGPQDIINKQLAAIASSGASDAEKAQATERAWTQFLQAANQFAAANPKQATVVQQAIYKTPDLTNTVQSLMGGKNPLDPSFTNMASQGIATGAAGQNPGPSVGGTLLRSGLSAATPFIIGGLRGGGAGATGGTQGGGGVSITDAAGNVIPQTGTVTMPGTSTGLLDRIFSANNLPNLISGGASVAGAILQGRAANNAATLQANAANNAAQLQSKAAQDELAFEKQIYGDLQAQNKPFLEAGTNALSEIQKLIGEGGDLSKPFTAPTAEEVRATPGYQFKLDEAMKQLGRQTRGVTSGATIKAAERFVNDYADSQYNEATNRAMDIFQTNRANRLNPLFQIAGFGPNAVSTSAQAGRAAANANTNILTNQADALGEAGVYGANARAGAGIQTTNALTAALQQIANLAQQRRQLTQSSVG